MAKRKSDDPPLERLLSYAKEQLVKLTHDSAIREFVEQEPPEASKLTSPGKSAAKPGISPLLAQELEQAAERKRELDEMLSHGRSSDIRRAQKLFLKAPDHWYARLDAVASLPKDPWHEQPDELKRRYMRRYGLSAGDVDSEEVDWPGAWEPLGEDFRYPEDIHFVYAAVADAMEAHGCIVIVPEQIRRKKPQVWQGYAGRLVYDLGLLPQLLDWIERDLSEQGPAKVLASHHTDPPQEDVHVALNADSRTLTIGEYQLHLKGQVWKLMRALVDEKLLNRARPRCSDWKNARDMLQRQLRDKGVNLTKVWPKAILETVEDRYILPATVEIKKNSQRGIKRTHLAPPPRD